MKRLIVLSILILLVAGLFVLGTSDGSPPIADTTVAGNQLTSSAAGEDDSGSATAIITITMTPVSLPDE